ncbi:unnamed protein product [Penicillium camemberti]|uniref:Str. FM013 n=1 Tax=Penicillium camemberti (strain FM 013) TaxID=1429867 RepID=A0A0G4PYB4_PENC3|nr:unnamed protein product [Penicillium camemberti]
MYQPRYGLKWKRCEIGWSNLSPQCFPAASVMTFI